MIEEWRDIENYENYQVSNLGNVKNKITNKILKQQIRRSGYCDVGLYSKERNQPKIFKVHRLVAKAFLPNPNNYPILNHKDENRTNNNANNLEWCTYQYNNTYGTVNDKKRKRVLQFDSDNNFIREYESVVEASKYCNIFENSISRSCRTHYKAGGYIFKYAIDI